MLLAGRGYDAVGKARGEEGEEGAEEEEDGEDGYEEDEEDDVLWADGKDEAWMIRSLDRLAIIPVDRRWGTRG